LSDYVIETLKPTLIPDFNISNPFNPGEFNLHKATSLIDFYNQNLSFDNSSAFSIFSDKELEMLQNKPKPAPQNIFNKDKQEQDKAFEGILPDVQRNQLFKVTSNPIKEIKDKQFLEGLFEEIRNKILNRKLLTLKNANGEPISYNNIIELVQLSDEEWRKATERQLLSLKNADNQPFSGCETCMFAKLTDKQWGKVNERKLLSFKTANNIALYAYEINELSTLTDEQWNNVSKRNLVSFKTDNIPVLCAHGICQFAKLSDKQWENLNKRDILSIDEISENMDDTIVDITTRLAELSDEEWINSEKKTALLKELKQLTEDPELKASTLYNLSGNKFEQTNELLYGKKSTQLTKMLDDFKKEYPDFELLMNNNVSEEKAKEIIDVVKEFINNHKNSDLPYATRFMFTNMRECGGFYNPGADGDTIFLHIHTSEDELKSAIVHENGHFRDFLDYVYDENNIPKDVAKILKKVLWDYSLTNNLETIAVLTSAIETPDNVDSVNPLTKILHVRKDENNNYYLMLPKDCNVSKEELEKLGRFLRDIHCPEIMPDYDESKHGDIASYNQTLIREQQTPENIAKYIADSIETEELTVINRIKDRGLLTRKNNENKSLYGVEIMFLAKLNDAEWGNISKRNLTSIKNAEDKLFDNIDICALASLTDKQWNLVQVRKLFTLKNADNAALTGDDISALSQLSEEEWNKVQERGLLDLKNDKGKALDGNEISTFAKLSDTKWAKQKQTL